MHSLKSLPNRKMVKNRVLVYFYIYIDVFIFLIYLFCSILFSISCGLKTGVMAGS